MPQHSVGPAGSGGRPIVEGVFESGDRIRLIKVGPDGVMPWITVVLREVPAYQWSTFTGCALLVMLIAALTRGLLAEVGGVARVVAGIVAVAIAWLVTTTLARRVWVRLVESVVADTAQAILDTDPNADPSPERGVQL